MDPVAEAPSTGDQERRQIAGRAAIVALGTLVSRILGLGRDIVLAAAFTRAATDAWMLAFQIPNLLRQLLAEGAVQTAVLPVLTRIRETEGEAAAREFFRVLRGLSLLLLCLISALGMAFSDQLVLLFAPGFRGQEGQFALASLLTRWAFPYIFFMSAAALGMAALNSHRRFVVTSFSPGLLNVALIATAFALPSALEKRGWPGILAMAIGALLGGLLQVVSQLPSLRRIGYLSLPRLSLRHPAVRDVARRLAPTLVGVGVYYLDVIIGRRILSELGQGAISYYSYALRLCDFSQGIFVMALSSATLPSLSTFAAKGQLDEVGETFAYAMRHALFIGLLATVAFAVLAEPIVTVLLQRGEFDAVASRETSRALVAQGVSIFLVAGVRQLVLVYFALGDTKTPVLVAALDVLVFAATALLLTGPMGHVGVSVAVSVARVCQFGLLFWKLKAKLPSRHGPRIVRSATKTLLASAAAGAAAWLVQDRLAPCLGDGLAPQLLLLGSAGSALMLVFIGCAKALRSDELLSLSEPIARRFRRFRSAGPE